MSLLASYGRFRFLWGGADIEIGSGQYPSTQTDTTGLGASAIAGVGVGVRRAILQFDRTLLSAGEDVAEMHFDFLNLTGGAPDDTWTSADYTTLEGLLDTWWGSAKAACHTKIKLVQIAWYRHGPGIVPPNPAQRVVSRSVIGTASTNAAPPQVSCSLTLRTGLRRSWGRTYLPGLSATVVDSNGRLAGATITTLANALDTLYKASNSADFPMVVVSKAHSAIYTLEATEVDDVLDVIRRRRFTVPVTRSIINT